MLEFDFGLSEGAIMLLYTLFTLLVRSGYIKKFKVTKKETDDKIGLIVEKNDSEKKDLIITINYLADCRIADLTRRLELETDPDKRYEIQEEINKAKDKRL